MRTKRPRLALACEATWVAALVTALAGMTFGLSLLTWAGMALALPAYALCVCLAGRSGREDGHKGIGRGLDVPPARHADAPARTAGPGEGDAA
jgi:hypothetical protein